MCIRASRFTRSLIMTSALLSAGMAQAGVVVDGTRVVYPSNQREVSVSLRNVGETPSLVQVWIDAGEDKSQPADAKVPFALTPPLFRLDPAKGQTLRLIYTQEPLPTDRESVFWLNVLDIPPRTAGSPENPNRLEMAFRHRLKLFFRPANLPGSAATAASAVTWSVIQHDGASVLEARNPTAFDVSFSDAAVSAQNVTLVAKPEMVRPFSSAQFPLQGPANRLTGGVTVHFGFINDFGATVQGDADAHLAP